LSIVPVESWYDLTYSLIHRRVTTMTMINT